MQRQGLFALYLQGVKEIEVTARIKDFSTTVSRQGTTIPTILLVNICNAKTGERLCDHSWIVARYSTGETFAKGKTIRFIANIQNYGNDKVGIGYLKKAIV